MGIWIELGVFLLVFVWAWFQFRELKKERLKREQRKLEEQRDQQRADAGDRVSPESKAP
jgi:hypothetical protein